MAIHPCHYCFWVVDLSTYVVSSDTESSHLNFQGSVIVQFSKFGATASATAFIYYHNRFCLSRTFFISFFRSFPLFFDSFYSLSKLSFLVKNFFLLFYSQPAVPGAILNWKKFEVLYFVAFSSATYLILPLILSIVNTLFYFFSFFVVFRFSYLYNGIMTHNGGYEI